jgi:hypothetical protein
MRRRCFPSVLPGFLLPFAFLAGSTSYAAVDPGLLALVPPDAQVASGVQIDSSRTSPFGQFVLAHMQSNSARLQMLIDQTGFDPRSDVKEVLCASNGVQPQPSFLILARGTFNPAKIEAAAVAKGATIQNYMGFDIIQNQDATHPAGVTFLDNTLAVAADLATVQYAIAHRTDMSGGAPKVSAALLTGITTASTGNDAWFVSLVPGTNFFPNAALNLGESATGQNSGQAVQGATLQSIQQSTGGVHFGDQIAVHFQAVTRSDKDATSLADVVRFFASMVQMERDSNPQAAILANAVDNMNLQTSDNTLSLAVSIPEKDLETLAQNAPKMHRPAKAQ